MEHTLKREVKVYQGKNELLDILREELNVKEVVLRDKNGIVTKKYDGERTYVYTTKS